MRALITGASSFTGAWFVRGLRAEGFAVTATCRRALPEYDGLARARLDMVLGHGSLVPDFRIDEQGLCAVLSEPVDLLCLHGATVGDHRAESFNPMAALASDTHALDALLNAFAAQGGSAVLVTGSIFEADAGQGTAPRGAVSAYGLAKTLSWEAIRHAVERRGLTLGRYVIPHPFGALEKPGLTASLAGSWRRSEVPAIQQPRLVRDFVPADALALGYAHFARQLVDDVGLHRLTPSLWAEPTVEFVARFSRQLGQRLGLTCQFAPASEPAPTSEPRIRVGIEPLAPILGLRWDELRCWDRLSKWYAGMGWTLNDLN